MIYNNGLETETLEFKKSLAELDKGIVSLTAMLNKGGFGKVVFGVDNKGGIVGTELGNETIRKISIRCNEGIRPAMVPKISVENFDGKMVVSLEGRGNRRPYSAFGDYRIRVGSENKKIDPEELGDLFFSNPNFAADNLECIDQDLTFVQLKTLFSDRGLKINEKTFAKNIGLLTAKGKYNCVADILADNNNCSMKVVRFAGRDKIKMLLRNEYGYKCMLLAMKQIYEYVCSLNEVRVDLESGLQRKEVPLFDTICFDEAWTNACLHNRWVRNVSPAVYIFEDRMEIVSIGGLPLDFSQEDFFAGVSRPVNLRLQKIMGQLGMVEQTGHGVPTIIAKYGREAFELGDNHITVTIPFAFPLHMMHSSDESLPPAYRGVLDTIRMDPYVTGEELGKKVNLGKTRITTIIAELKRMGRIRRIGSNRGGYWLVEE